MERFLQILVQDEGFRAAFLGQRTPEDAYEVARPYLDGMSMGEFIQKLELLSNDLEGIKQGRTRISADKMGNVSGGTVDWLALTQNILSLGLGLAGGIKQIVDVSKKSQYRIQRALPLPTDITQYTTCNGSSPYASQPIAYRYKHT